GSATVNPTGAVTVRSSAPTATRRPVYRPDPTLAGSRVTVTDAVPPAATVSVSVSRLSAPSGTGSPPTVVTVRERSRTAAVPPWLATVRVRVSGGPDGGHGRAEVRGDRGHQHLLPDRAGHVDPAGTLLVHGVPAVDGRAH